MCQTSSPQQMPLNTAGAGGPSFTGNSVNAPDDANGVSTAVPGAPPNLYQGPNGGGDPLTNAIQAEQQANPQTVSVNAPTKFGKLLAIAAPILEGGLIGAAGGKGHPGGGFGAAQDFYNQRRAYANQQALLQHTLNNDQFKNALEAARTAHTIATPPFVRSATISGQDDQGNGIIQARNPFTGVYETVPGISPADKSKTPKTEMTDQGLVNVDGSTATPVTLPGPSTPPGTAMLPVRPNDPNSPRVPTAVPGSQAPGAPLHAPGFSTPKPTKTTNRNSAGVETDTFIDDNPNSPTFQQPIGKPVASRQPLPDKTANHDNDKADLQAQAETYAQAALDKNGGDPDKAIAYLNGLQVKDPDAQKKLNSMLPQIRKSIGDRTKSRKPKAKQSALDMLSQPSGSTQGQDDDENQ